ISKTIDRQVRDGSHAGHTVGPIRFEAAKVVSATQTLGRASHGVRIQSMPALMAISVEKRIGYGAVMDHVAIQLAFRVAIGVKRLRNVRGLPYDHIRGQMSIQCS